MKLIFLSPIAWILIVYPMTQEFDVQKNKFQEWQEHAFRLLKKQDVCIKLNLNDLVSVPDPVELLASKLCEVVSTPGKCSLATANQIVALCTNADGTLLFTEENQRKCYANMLDKTITFYKKTHDSKRKKHCKKYIKKYLQAYYAIWPLECSAFYKKLICRPHENVSRDMLDLIYLAQEFASLKEIIFNDLKSNYLADVAKIILNDKEYAQQWEQTPLDPGTLIKDLTNAYLTAEENKYRFSLILFEDAKPVHIQYEALIKRAIYIMYARGRSFKYNLKCLLHSPSQLLQNVAQELLIGTVNDTSLYDYQRDDAMNDLFASNPQQYVGMRNEYYKACFASGRQMDAIHHILDGTLEGFKQYGYVLLVEYLKSNLNFLPDPMYQMSEKELIIERKNILNYIFQNSNADRDTIKEALDSGDFVQKKFSHIVDLHLITKSGYALNDLTVENCD